MTASETTSRRCFGCDEEISSAPGSYYCDKCVYKQMAEQGDELAVFDAYHRWADSRLRDNPTACNRFLA